MILSPIEQRIKEKIEQLGTPLKEWQINIYRGILTGYNEAFIIDGKKKEELIKQDPKSAEIIRPILRGRDVKRYGYEFADLFLIATFPSRKYNIDYFPAVKEHLLSFGFDRLKQTGEYGTRKKTNNKWFETQDSISYLEDFYKQKIIYPNMTKFLPFLYDEEVFLTNQKCFIISGENIQYLTAFFNSSVFIFCSTWKWKTGKNFVSLNLEVNYVKAKKYSAEEKVMILREHLEKNVPISNLSDQHGLSPNVIYLWKKQLFEGATALFERKSNKPEREESKYKERIKELEHKLSGRENLISDLVTDLIETKKKHFGEAYEKN